MKNNSINVELTGLVEYLREKDFLLHGSERRADRLLKERDRALEKINKVLNIIKGNPVIEVNNIGNLIMNITEILEGCDQNGKNDWRTTRDDKRNIR